MCIRDRQIPEQQLRQSEIVVVVHMRKQHSLDFLRLYTERYQPVSDKISAVDKEPAVDKYTRRVAVCRGHAGIAPEKDNIHLLHSNQNSLRNQILFRSTSNRRPFR